MFTTVAKISIEVAGWAQMSRRTPEESPHVTNMIDAADVR
jgi:hypothetical protein